VVRDQLETGGPIDRAATVVAGWARYAEGVDDDGRPFDVVDARAEQLTARARRQREEPLAFLADRELFGDLADDERFAAAFRAALTALHDHGALRTVRSLAGDA
jgi:mannitol 2-dehydrogenase